MNNKQTQNQGQTQIQLVKLMSLNGWLEALAELDRYDNLPYNYQFAKFAKGQMLDDINYCITQTLVPVKQIREDIRDNSISFKKRFVTIILEYQSLRLKSEFDLIDELCSIVISNSIGLEKEVPYRIPKNEIPLTEDALNEFMASIGKSSVEVEKQIKELMESGKALKFSMIDSSKKDFKKGLSRYEDTNPQLFKDIVNFLNS